MAKPKEGEARVAELKEKNGTLVADLKERDPDGNKPECDYLRAQVASNDKLCAKILRPQDFEPKKKT